jgi:hypothetical protein
VTQRLRLPAGQRPGGISVPGLTSTLLVGVNEALFLSFRKYISRPVPRRRRHFTSDNSYSRKKFRLQRPGVVERNSRSGLALRRLEAGLTQTMLADALGISFQQSQFSFTTPWQPAPCLSTLRCPGLRNSPFTYPAPLLNRVSIIRRAKSVRPRMASGLLVCTSIGCPKSEVSKQSEPKVRSYHDVLRRRS